MTDVPAIIRACIGGDPTTQQWDAISMPLEPYVIVAGAGSGKTAVMAARVAYLATVADPTINPGDVLCLTFTNRATENLTLRIRRALASTEHAAAGEEPTVTNYHRFGQDIVRRHGLRIGIEPDLRVLTATQRAQLCARVLDRMPFHHLHTSDQRTIVGAILSLHDQAQDHRVDLGELAERSRERSMDPGEGKAGLALAELHAERAELALAGSVFDELKREIGAIDFGDQIALALRIVETHPEVAREYRDRFAAVLLDEYQDTNVAQARLLRALFGDGHPVTAVGDPDQNIYAWRGASLHNLLAFPAEFPRADGSPSARLPLYVNFRSGSRILAAADEIIRPVPPEQRPDPDKALEPLAERGTGTVELRAFPDVATEAAAIADRVLDHRTAGIRWREIAVLSPRRSGFAPIARALEERDIPFEITGLAGLLEQPEIIDLLSYARAIADPQASVALARVLIGPRFRIGPADIAALAAWAKTRTRGPDADGGEVPYLVAEALHRLDEVHGLTDEGRARLAEVRADLDGLRDASRGPVVSFLAEVARRTGLLEELDAHPLASVGTSARRNISAFLDQVAAFRPLEGETTLGSLLEHLDLLAASEDEDWSGPTGDTDAVQLMTIHAAKGLEFDAVFVTGLAEGRLPDTKKQQDPRSRASSLDFDLRGDAELFHGLRMDMKDAAWKDALKAMALADERRTCYVALTRARAALWCSTALWFEGRTTQAKVGTFLDQLWGWADRTGDADTERVDAPEGEGAPERSDEDAASAPLPAWPGPARPDEAEARFPQGWRRAALEVAGAGGGVTLLDGLDVAQRDDALRDIDERRALAAHLVERERALGGEGWLPPQLSVNGVVLHARCPKRFYWTSVRPLPRFSGASGRIGTDLHRWIERTSQGQTTLLDDEARPDMTDEDLAGEPGIFVQLQAAFRSSRFADLVPLHVERSFLLPFGRFTVGGRIDAIYGTEDGAWEVVDWKTGRMPDADDPTARLQLDLYALACMEIWGKRREDVRLTYVYLREGRERSSDAPDPSDIRARVGSQLADIEAYRFTPVPGPGCRWCDFAAFCPEGAASLAQD